MPKKPKYKQWKTLKWNTPSALSIGVLMLMFLFAYLEWSRPESEKPKVPASAQLVPLPNFDDDQRGVAPTENVQVIMQHMHDPKAFTQGLTFHKGYFYETTGLYKRSVLRKTTISGEVLQETKFKDTLFGEGNAIVGDKLFAITWREHVGIVFDLLSFEILDKFRVDTEGWGLTWNGSNLLMTDGSDKLYFYDPETFEVLKVINVWYRNSPGGGKVSLNYLNELEFIDGFVYSNIWMTDKIAIIDPADGAVVKWISAEGMHRKKRGEDVLNGIAFDPSTRRLWVTGKLYRNLYEIEFISPFQSL